MSDQPVEEIKNTPWIEALLADPKKRKQLYYGVLGVLAVIALFFVYRQKVVVPRELEAYERMFVAEYYFGQDSLDVALTGRPGSFDGFLTIIEDYSGTDAANLAHLYTGIIYLNKGNFSEAIDYLKAYKGNDAIIAPSALGCIGDAYSEMGDYDNAARYYLQAANKHENPFTTPRFLRKEAIARLEIGQKEQALKAFKRLRDDFYQTAEGREAERHLSRLEVELGK